MVGVGGKAGTDDELSQVGRLGLDEPVEVERSHGPRHEEDLREIVEPVDLLQLTPISLGVLEQGHVPHPQTMPDESHDGPPKNHRPDSVQDGISHLLLEVRITPLLGKSKCCRDTSHVGHRQPHATPDVGDVLFEKGDGVEVLIENVDGEEAKEEGLGHGRKDKDVDGEDKDRFGDRHFYLE